MITPTWKRRLNLTLWSFLIVYFASYICLSLAGRYSTFLVASGRHKYTFGLSIPDESVWQPLGVTVLPYDMNLLGVIYYGPVLADRAIWHQSHRTME
jgi:hypothetical protein